MTMPDAAEHATFVLERHYPRGVERVWELLSNPRAKRQWYLEGEGMTIHSYDMDFVVGGWERARYSFQKGTPVDGLPFANDGVLLDIVTGERIVQAFTMSIANRIISATMVTFELTADGRGSTLTLTHQGVFFPGSDGPEMREHGWNALLDRLGAAVSANTP